MIDKTFRKNLQLLYCKLGFMLLFIFVLIKPDSASSEDTHELKVGVYDFQPLVFVDTDGKAKGFFIDIINDIAIQQKWVVTYIQGDFNQCLNRLNSGEIDLLAGVAYSDERAKDFDFTNEPMLTIWAEIYKPKKNPIKSIID
ncbi:MAG: transporter substrate-binding domain-containing protein, partial [Desulfamplus sp.]|nr:transporter substrate-binding domain-containing protein [Desulfamplus sp.]